MKRLSCAVILLFLAVTIDAFAATPIKILKTRIEAVQPPENLILETIRSHIDLNKYREVRTQLIRDDAGNPSHYLAYLLSPTYHRVDFVKISLDQQFKVLGVEENYKLQGIDIKQQPGYDATHASCPDTSVQFIAFAPNDVQVEQDVTNDVASAATAAGLKTVKLLKSQATRANYLNYMSCPNVVGNFYDGDANPYSFTTVDGSISADDFKTLLNGKFHYLTYNIWLACEAYNDPMLSAVLNNAEAKKYAAGINNLLIGPSDKAGACAMKAAVAGKPMQASFNVCYQQLDDKADHWGFGGNGTDYFRSPGYFCGASFPNPIIKYDHKDSAGRIYIPVQNWSVYSNDLFKAAPEMPACGTNKNSSRTWVNIFDAVTNARIYGFCALGANSDLKSLWFKPGTAHGKVYVILEDRDCGKKYKSNTLSW